MSKKFTFVLLMKICIILVFFLLSPLMIADFFNQTVYAADFCTSNSDCGCNGTDFCDSANYCSSCKVRNDRTFYVCRGMPGSRFCDAGSSSVLHIDACASPCDCASAACVAPTNTPVPTTPPGQPTNTPVPGFCGDGTCNNGETKDSCCNDCKAPGESCFKAACDDLCGASPNYAQVPGSAGAPGCYNNGLEPNVNLDRNSGIVNFDFGCGYTWSYSDRGSPDESLAVLRSWIYSTDNIIGRIPNGSGDVTIDLFDKDPVALQNGRTYLFVPECSTGSQEALNKANVCYRDVTIDKADDPCSIKSYLEQGARTQVPPNSGSVLNTSPFYTYFTSPYGLTDPHFDPEPPDGMLASTNFKVTCDSPIDDQRCWWRWEWPAGVPNGNKTFNFKACTSGLWSENCSGGSKCEVAMEFLVGVPSPTPTPTPAHIVKGYLGYTSCTAMTGWTGDSANRYEPTDVHFYFDGPAGTGVGYDPTSPDLTTIEREPAVCEILGGSVNNCSACSNVAPFSGLSQCIHGFNYPLPQTVTSGSNTINLFDGNDHTIYAYGLDINEDPSKSVLLTDSPKTIRCNPPTPTPAACNGVCTGNTDCSAGLICSVGLCRNNLCLAESSCICPVATPTPTPPPVPVDTLTCNYSFTNGSGVKYYTTTLSWDPVVVGLPAVYPYWSQGSLYANYPDVISGWYNGWTSALYDTSNAYASGEKIYAHVKSRDALDNQSEWSDAKAEQSIVLNDTNCTVPQTPTPTPAACNGVCTGNSDCSAGLFCYIGQCRNNLCLVESSCICPTATPTPTQPPICSGSSLTIDPLPPQQLGVSVNFLLRDLQPGATECYVEINNISQDLSPATLGGMCSVDWDTTATGNGNHTYAILVGPSDQVCYSGPYCVDSLAPPTPVSKPWACTYSNSIGGVNYYDVTFSHNTVVDTGCAGLNAFPYRSQLSTTNTYATVIPGSNNGWTTATSNTAPDVAEGTTVYAHAISRDVLDNQSAWSATVSKLITAVNCNGPTPTPTPPPTTPVPQCNLCNLSNLVCPNSVNSGANFAINYDYSGTGPDNYPYEVRTLLRDGTQEQCTFGEDVLQCVDSSGSFNVTAPVAAGTYTYDVYCWGSSFNGNTDCGRSDTAMSCDIDVIVPATATPIDTPTPIPTATPVIHPFCPLPIL